MKVVLSLATIGILAMFINPALGQSAVTTAKTQSGKARAVEIVSGGAAQSDLHLNWMREFGSFERANPAIARQFRRDPSLVRNVEFRNEHSSWAAFLREHPAIRADIEANPGNYLVVSPDLAYVSEHARQSTHMLRSKTKAKA
ncbi:MAG TPA: hypothetical protein VNE82_16215 [Candidatus Binataceae bacterium]|nr:hypothetical protein [Candidatus Binataceae bacterium]